MRKPFSLEAADLAVPSILSLLEGCFRRVEIVGSVRRRAAQVLELAVLVIEAEPGRTVARVAELAASAAVHLREHGPGHVRFIHRASSLPVQIDMTTWDVWWTNLFVRTGDPRFVARCAQHAAKKGLTLNRDGKGLERPDGRRIKVYSERGLFEVLGLPFVRPEDRCV